VTGERKSIKILGAIELWRTRFDYRQDTVFNAATYLGFLEQLARHYRRQGAILIRTTPLTTRTPRSGLGSSAIAIGWKYTSYHLTRRN
jgi:hypothetical protein